MKLKLWLFTLLIGLFSTAGFCSLPFTDLAENSNKESVIETSPVMVELEMVLAVSNEVKATLADCVLDEVPVVFSDVSFISTNLQQHVISFKPDVIVCIRDKLRVV